MLLHRRHLLIGHGSRVQRGIACACVCVRGSWGGVSVRRQGSVVVCVLGIEASKKRRQGKKKPFGDSTARRSLDPSKRKIERAGWLGSVRRSIGLD